MSNDTDESPLSEGPLATDVFQLRLYVAGQSPRSVRALENLRRVCDEHLAGRYHVEVIDLLQNPALARGDEILAVPTLVRKLPEPTTDLTVVAEMALALVDLFDVIERGRPIRLLGVRVMLEPPT